MYSLCCTSIFYVTALFVVRGNTIAIMTDISYGYASIAIIEHVRKMFVVWILLWFAWGVLYDVEYAVHAIELGF